MIDIEVPGWFEPSDPGGEALSFMLAPYTLPGVEHRSSWLPWETLDRTIAALDAFDHGAGAKYPGWQTLGQTRWFLRHMMQMAYAFRHHIPPRWPYHDGPFPERFACEDLAEALSNTLRHDTGFVDVSQRPDCGAPPTRERVFKNGVYLNGSDRYTFDSRCPDAPRNPPSGSTSKGSIHFCPCRVRGFAGVSDFFLYWGNRAYWYALRVADDPVDALSALAMARRCGKVVLGSMATRARTFVHEMAHLRVRPHNHCESSCCQAGLAGWFYGRTRSECGAVEVDVVLGGRPGPRGVIDTEFALRAKTYSDLCDPQRLVLLPTPPYIEILRPVSFRMEMTFLEAPGVESDPDNVLVVVDIPERCAPGPAAVTTAVTSIHP